MTITGTMLTEKGNLKPAARTAILDQLDAATLASASAVEGKPNVFTIDVTDEAGNTAYINIDVTVSTTHPSNRAVKKPSSKKAKDTETFEIAD